MPKSCDITGITKGRDQFIPFCHCPTCTWGVVGRAMDETLTREPCGHPNMIQFPPAVLKGAASPLHATFALGHLWTRVHMLCVESPSLSWPCPLTGERERISVATVCGPGIMAAAPFPDLRLFSWGNNSAQMARSQVGKPSGWPEHVTTELSRPQG